MKKFEMIFLMSFLFSISLLAQKKIELSLNTLGRKYEGIGALSAGASSRLLIDYKEPYRSQILDYLFKPQFGASLQHFKVEIGGDVNSTSGTEPSHARTEKELLNPKEEYFNRGYEWWLMKEAKKRNPNIVFDILEWGAPGWIGNGKFYSDDNIQYIISFIKGAKKYHDLDISYIGIWNERMYNTEYIKRLRNLLDSEGLNSVKIVAADLQEKKYIWSIGQDLLLDKELRNAVNVVGDHYIENRTDNTSPEYLQKMNIPLWNSEGGPWRGDWEGFKKLAVLYNQSYVKAKITKIITWSLITSYYDNLAIPNSGLMKANTPWSGFYDVQPAIWAVAHTTQFIKPGWRYIDSGCQLLDKGSIVSLVSPNMKDMSLVVETMDAPNNQKIQVEIDETIDIDSLFCWKSVLGKDAFKQDKIIRVKNNSFIFEFEPNSIYSFTTTKGQKKGEYNIPKSKAFPLPYMNDFEKEKEGSSPLFFSDQGGAFEVVTKKDGKGKCLRQVITRPCIEWEGDVLNQTIIGDTIWENYDVSVDVYFNEPYSSSFLLSRLTETYRSHKNADAYRLELNSSGHWKLYAKDKILKSGWISVKLNTWYKLAISVKNSDIVGLIDGKELCRVKDETYKNGMVGLGSSFHLVDFDNIQIVEK